jgi:hypothetical protein
LPLTNVHPEPDDSEGQIVLSSLELSVVIPLDAPPKTDKETEENDGENSPTSTEFREDAAAGAAATGDASVSSAAVRKEDKRE